MKETDQTVMPEDPKPETSLENQEEVWTEVSSPVAETEEPAEADKAENGEESPKTAKKKRKWLWIPLALVLLLALSGIGDFFGTLGSKEPLAFEVSGGSGTSVLAKQLKAEGVIRHPLLFKLYVRVKGEPVYQRGVHFLSDSMSYDQLLAALTSQPDSVKNQRKIVIPEGYELHQIVSLLVENGLGDEATFYHEIQYGTFDFPFVADIPRIENRLEGYLYPDTYLFTTEDSEHEILSRMLQNFSDKALPIYQAYTTDRTLDEIVILASMIEREAANDGERPLVASVFENRMAIDMKLESCATVQYILKERKPILSTEDTAIESPYNTYLHPGLPIGPIASPGLSSLKAALLPADTNYLYFLAKEDGSGNIFSETFDQHNLNLSQTQGESF